VLLVGGPQRREGEEIQPIERRYGQARRVREIEAGGGMGLVTSAAGMIGGLGLFLLGTRLAASGMGVALGGTLRRAAASWRSLPRKAFLGGLGMSAMLGGSGTLPTAALTLASRLRLRKDLAMALVLGASFGPLCIAALALLACFDCGLLEIALVAIGSAALLMSFSSTHRAWGEGQVGLGLCLLGLALSGESWAAVATHGRLPSIAGNWLVALPYLAIGAATGTFLRSPGAAAVLVMQATAAGVIDGLSGAASMVGVLVSLGAGSLLVARGGRSDERSLAAVHVAFVGAAALIGAATILWGAGAPALFDDALGSPGLALLVFLAVASGVSALCTWVLFDPLQRFLADRLQSQPDSTDSARVVNLTQETVPALALESLAASVDEAARDSRDIAQRILSGHGPSAQRWEQAWSTINAVDAEVRHARHSLQQTRWPGSAVEGVLLAGRCTALWQEILQELAALPECSALQASSEFKMRLVHARLCVLQYMEQADGLSLSQRDADPWQERNRIARELEELRSEIFLACAVGGLPIECLPSIVNELEVLNSVARKTLDAEECRAGINADGREQEAVAAVDEVTTALPQMAT